MVGAVGPGRGLPKALPRAVVFLFLSSWLEVEVLQLQLPSISSSVAFDFDFTEPAFKGCATVVSMTSKWQDKSKWIPNPEC